MTHGTGTDQVGRLAAALADRYRLERELGAGGMATVYLAQDLRHDRRVAVKVLRPELAAVIGADRFLAEIRTTANLQHPHILPLFDSGAADSFLFYVMPYIEGESLRDRLTREKQLPIADAVRIAGEVASALDYAHRHGVIHRDIKPENILLHDGQALVADFGIALAASKASGSRMTETGMSLGTPHYMSPEQAMGEREITARSDVYALGAMTYEMLLGEPPFTGPTAQSIVAKVMTEKPARLIPRRERVPPAVETAVLTALEKLPADRYASAAEFAQALTSPAAAATATRAMPAQPRRVSRAPLMGAALVAVAGLVLAVALLRRHDAPHAVARMLLQLRVGQELHLLPYPNLAAPPDASGITYLGPGVNASDQPWLRRWDQLQAQRLSQSVDQGCCAAFSPSGDTLAYLSSPRQLNLLPLTGGRPSALPDVGLVSMSDWGGGLDWGADGFLYGVSPTGLLRIDPRQGTAKLVAPVDSARGDLVFLWPELLPGGQRALVTVVPKKNPFDPEQASIGVADLKTGHVEIVQQGVRALYAPTGHLVTARANGVLWATAFDAGTGRVSGAARELADTVAVRAGNSAPGVVDFVLDRRGTLAYVTGTAGTQPIMVVDRTGASQPFDSGPAPVTFSGAAYNPDGKRIAATFGGEDRGTQLWLISTDGSPRIRLTFDGYLTERPRWRPGTNTISYLTDRETPGSPLARLYQLDATGHGTPVRVPIGDPRSVGGHTWSPDGQWLVFRTDNQEAGGGDIMAIRPGVDTIARPLVATDAEELAPTISPDGRWMAYSSNESGRREVYVRPFPETGGGRYQISTAGGSTPLWSPLGDEIFYQDATPSMVAVPVTSGPTLRVGRPVTLFSLADYYTNPFSPQFEVSPDGRRFIIARQSAGSAFGIAVVFNFLDELKRRMAAK